MAATYTVGTGKTYSTIQSAVDAVPGDLSGQGLQTVEVYGKVGPPLNTYTEYVDARTGFTNASAADYILITAMISHGGLETSGIIVTNAVGVGFSMAAYGQVEGFNIGPVAHPGGGNAVGVVTGETGATNANIIHDITCANRNAFAIQMRNNAVVYNNICYNIRGNRAIGRSCGILMTALSTVQYLIFNNTVYNVTDIGGAPAFGVYFEGGGNVADEIRNNAVFNSTNQCYIRNGGNQPISTNNMSSDATATAFGGINHYPNRLAVNQFVNIGAGAEDFHLLGTSECVDNGSGQVNPPVNSDIDGNARPMGLGYDISADELVQATINLTNISLGYERFRKNQVMV